MRRSLLVYNPAAGQWWKRPRPEHIRDALAARGFEAKLLVTQGHDHATELVRAHLSPDVERVWVCGGDGTVAQAAAALIGLEVPLAILPTGTVNVLALECGIPSKPLRALELLSRTTKYRVFRAWSVAERAVLLGVGVGFEARTIGYTNAKLKDWLGFVAVGTRGVLEWARYEFPALRVTGEDARGEPFELRGTQVLVTNPKRYAGHQIVVPSADPTDSCLEIVLFDGTSRWQLAKFWAGIELPGTFHLRVPGVEILRARRLQVTAEDGRPVEVHVNGDLVERTPVAVEPWGTVRLLAAE